MKKEIILKLIELYCYVSAIYDSRLAYSVQRFSNNCSPKFTDQEIMTIYLWATLQKQYTKKDVYKYAINHLTEYFLIFQVIKPLIIDLITYMKPLKN